MGDGNFSTRKDEFEDSYWKNMFPVVGVGGIGTEIVDRLNERGLDTSLLIAIDTDRANLERIHADIRIHIGKSISKECKGNSLLGMLAAQRAQGTIEKFLEDARLTFVVAAVGGGTGAGASTVVGQIAQEYHGVVIGIAIVPFSSESTIPSIYQQELLKFMESVDSLIIIESDQFRKYTPDASQELIFETEKNLIARTIYHWIRMMTGPSYVHITINDLRLIFHGGPAVMCLADATISDGPEYLASKCLAYPLCSPDILPGGFDLFDARDGLAFFIGGEDLDMGFAESICHHIKLELRNIDWILPQLFFRPGCQERLHVIAIFTSMR